MPRLHCSNDREAKNPLGKRPSSPVSVGPGRIGQLLAMNDHLTSAKAVGSQNCIGLGVWKVPTGRKQFLKPIFEVWIPLPARQRLAVVAYGPTDASAGR
jgi:hypothetical protein